ncbi:unnamed protein product [Chrysodeixis includens]|uniref:Uncharacterized protein n=1 Tax=Chrysodeixis includens TaxID=689277 RepID=A0A9P0BNC2_CHRIL|nr:unnamed protein product [Chrysodeixis includens]
MWLRTARNILVIIAVVWLPECRTRHRKPSKTMWAVAPPPKYRRNNMPPVDPDYSPENPPGDPPDNPPDGPNENNPPDGPNENNPPDDSPDNGPDNPPDGPNQNLPDYLDNSPKHSDVDNYENEYPSDFDPDYSPDINNDYGAPTPPPGFEDYSPTMDPEQLDFERNRFKGEANKGDPSKSMKELGSGTSKIRVCYIIATTYMSSLRDLRKYFYIRHFYENNVDYEVGYVTNEIITKYQKMLEIYYMAQKRYFYDQDRNFAPPTYMIYLYTNLLELATVIGHLSNMLHEIEDKYKAVPKSGFSDYHLGRENKYDLDAHRNRIRAEAALQRQLAREKRMRARQRKKMREKNLYIGYKPTPPPRRPKIKRRWPLHYGWSIENW